MSNQLQENLNIILEEKNTKLLPENLKAGVTCLGVTGELEGGIDTSDATATAKDIARETTAYVNGKKIEGDLPVIGSTAEFTSEDVIAINNETSEQRVHCYFRFPKDIIMRTRATLNGAIPYNYLVGPLLISADKIVKGNTILGVEGTAETSGGKVDLKHISFYGSNLDGASVIEELKKVNTEAFTRIDGMFYNCQDITSLDLTPITFGTLTSMANTFNMCINMRTLNLSHLSTENVTNMNFLFLNCNNLQELDISSFDFTNVEYYNDAFTSIPDDCLIYVKDQAAKDWLLSAKTTFTNIQIKS